MLCLFALDFVNADLHEKNVFFFTSVLNLLMRFEKEPLKGLFILLHQICSINRALTLVQGEVFILAGDTL